MKVWVPMYQNDRNKKLIMNISLKNISMVVTVIFLFGSFEIEWYVGRIIICDKISDINIFIDCNSVRKLILNQTPNYFFDSSFFYEI